MEDLISKDASVLKNGRKLSMTTFPNRHVAQQTTPADLLSSAAELGVMRNYYSQGYES